MLIQHLAFFVIQLLLFTSVIHKFDGLKQIYLYEI